MSGFPTLVDSAHVAERLNVSRGTVARWVHSGRLTPVTKGRGLRGGWLFDVVQVETLAAQRQPDQAAG